jgi:hypothetical protein
MAACSLLGASTERERRSEPGKEDRKEGEWRGVARGLQGILLVLHSEQEVAAAVARSKPRSCSW